MKINKFISVLLASAFCLTAAEPIATADNGSISYDNIMCIGDSITDGYGTDGSYRKFLYNDLDHGGYYADMLGPQCDYTESVEYNGENGEHFEYDPNHCGYSGYAIMEYPGRNGIYETIKNGDYFSKYHPDIVLLQIGTNDVIDNHDMDTASERLEVLVDHILENIGRESFLFVTTIPNLDPNRPDVYNWFDNYRHSQDWQTQYDDETAAANVQKCVDSYNAQVKALVKKKRQAGVRNIHFADINSVLDDVSAQLKDGVHPNDTGYRLMGDYWFEMLENYYYITDPLLKPDPVDEGELPAEPPTEPTTESSTESPSPYPSFCDLNYDNETDIADAVMLQRFLLGTETFTDEQAVMADINNDRSINIFDYVMLLRELINR